MVADVRHRLHHLQSRPKDWQAFFAAAAADPPLAEGVALARQLATDHDVVWLTGRPERLRKATTRWLGSHDLPTEPIHMRGDGDFRPARQTKLAVVRALAEQRTIALVVDDDPEVITALAKAGLPVRLADWVLYQDTLREGQEREGRN